MYDWKLSFPHYYKNDEEYLKPDSSLKARSMVIHFNYDFWEQHFGIRRRAMVSKTFWKDQNGEYSFVKKPRT